MAENNECCASCLHLYRLYDAYCCKHIGIVKKPNASCCMWYKKESMVDDGRYMSDSLDTFVIFSIIVVILWFCVVGYIFPMTK